MVKSVVEYKKDELSLLIGIVIKFSDSWYGGIVVCAYYIRGGNFISFFSKVVFNMDGFERNEWGKAKWN
jgi:hypothetical protein